MSRKLKDKYRKQFDITAPGFLGVEDNDVAEEKLIKIESRGLDLSTLVYIQAKTNGSPTWENIGSIDGTNSKILDISLYDRIRYNVYTFGGTESEIEIVSAVESDQNVIEKDINNKDSYRVVDTVPIEGDAKTAYLNAILTLSFWESIGFDVSTIDFVTTLDSEPILTRDGEFIEV